MQRYIVQRLLLFIPAMLGVTLVAFVLMRLVPGDIATILVYEAGTERAGAAEQAVQKMRRELGLDRPIAVQYANWLLGAVRGDFGYSYWERRPVSVIISERFPRTLQLALMTVVLALCWAVPLGITSAVRQDTALDYLARLEQGRAAHPSPSVLAALARALRLTREERGHLFRVAGQAEPGAGRVDRHITPGVQRILDRLADVPVMVVDAGWEVVALNPVATALIGDLSDEPNILRRHFSGMPSRLVRYQD